jgi:putative ABC transport system ATP-binding protein
MSLLMAKNITKIYGGQKNASSMQALNGIDLTIEEGEFVGIMGPSGSGKTTLLNILSGILKPNTGVVEIDGKSILELSSNELALFRRQSMGVVFQDFNLLDSLTIKENIILPMILGKKSPVEIQRKTKEIMSLFDIESIAEKYPYNVSGGQQQRAAVSRALVNNPEIIFADEPTGNLDSKSSKAVMECFEKMNKVQKKTIMIVTHDPFAASYCKRIIFIKDGSINMEIVSNGDRRAFFNRILDTLAVIGGDRSES